MTLKKIFGELTSEDFNVGDIIEWSTWNTETEEWNSNFGIITQLYNEMKVKRLVSIAKVYPLSSNGSEIELFTMSLRLISSGSA
jgi:abortive infection bacteriophage resistance protein